MCIRDRGFTRIYKKRGLKEMNYTYILRCSDGSLYTGWTNDIEKRLEQHNAGKGAKYTKGRTPVTLESVSYTHLDVYKRQ